MSVVTNLKRKKDINKRSKGQGVDVEIVYDFNTLAAQEEKGRGRRINRSWKYNESAENLKQKGISKRSR